MIDLVFAVIDTNVIVSYFLSPKDSPPNRIIDEIRKGTIIPLYSAYLLREYRRVLSDKRFGLDDRSIYDMLCLIERPGYDAGVELMDSGSSLPDRKDSPIFDIVQCTRKHGSYLITGNIKHFPDEEYVVTPRQMIDILDGNQ